MKPGRVATAPRGCVRPFCTPRGVCAEEMVSRQSQGMGRSLGTQIHSFIRSFTRSSICPKTAETCCVPGAAGGEGAVGVETVFAPWNLLSGWRYVLVQVMQGALTDKPPNPSGRMLHKFILCSCKIQSVFMELVCMKMAERGREPGGLCVSPVSPFAGASVGVCVTV